MKNINVNFLELKGTSYDIGKQLGNIVLENNHLKNIFINSQAISDNEKNVFELFDKLLWSSFFVTLRPNFHYRSYTLP